MADAVSGLGTERKWHRAVETRAAPPALERLRAPPAGKADLDRGDGIDFEGVTRAERARVGSVNDWLVFQDMFRVWQKVRTAVMALWGR